MIALRALRRGRSERTEDVWFDVLLRHMASMLRAGATIHEALTASAEIGDGIPGLVRMRRRLRLGASTDEALAALEVPGADLQMLRCLVTLHERLGGDVAPSLDAIADERAGRRHSSAEARAHTSGARLSARIVAGAPIFFAPLVPSATAPDALAIVTLIGGIGLGCLGFWWIGKVIPAPPPHLDHLALLARVVAGGVAGGSSPEVFLEAVAAEERHPLSRELAAARRKVWLGATWPEALARSGDPAVGELGDALAASASLGVPIAATLRAFAERRTRAERLRFEADVRRAPVRMVLPLTLCVLPAFVFLAVGPLVRGMAVSL